jgi:hypothetical protein
MSETITPERIQAAAEKMQAIALECVRVINTQHGADFIILRGKLPNKGWPRGKCVGSDSKGRFTAYSARNLLAAIAAHGYVTVEFEKKT